MGRRASRDPRPINEVILIDESFIQAVSQGVDPELIEGAVIDYLNNNPGTGEGLTIEQIKEDSQIASAIANTHVVMSDNQDLSGLQPKETGKGLSTNDYTTVEKEKLAGIAAGAEVNVNADWSALSGDAQILNKPTIPVVDNTAYGSSWDGNNDAPTKNAVYDKIETLGSAGLSLAQARRLIRR
jgi:hypothetical protein